MSEHQKAAAKSLIVDLQPNFTETLNVVRIAREHLPTLRQYIDNVLQHLKTQQLIQEYAPRYNLGSTRLIASELGSSPSLKAPLETPTIFEKAKHQKVSFGDIDIDIKANVSMQQIGEAIVSLYPRHVAFRLCGDHEINTAFVVEGIGVVQFDFVDVKDDANIEFNQFCSFVDITHELKGLVREILASAIAKTQPVTGYLQEPAQELIKQHINFIKDSCNVNEERDVLIQSGVRWSLGHDYLKLVAVFNKFKNGKMLKTPYNIEVHELQKRNTFGLYKPDMFIRPYSKIDEVARTVGISRGDHLYHSMYMLREIKRFDLSRKQLVWNEFIKGINRKRPTETAGGQLSNEEADRTIQIALPFFEGIEYNDNKNV